MTIIDDRQCDENAYKLDNYCYYYNGLHIYSHDDDGDGIMNISIITVVITYMLIMTMQVMNVPINQVILVLVTLVSPRTRNLPMFQ